MPQRPENAWNKQFTTIAGISMVFQERSSLNLVSGELVVPGER
jgi:hypothetical protein